jgi:hypothetical protein
MNKTYLGVGILILVIVGGLCFLVVDEPVVEPVPVEPVETATSTPATATTEAAMSTTSTSTTPDSQITQWYPRHLPLVGDVTVDIVRHVEVGIDHACRRFQIGSDNEVGDVTLHREGKRAVIIRIHHLRQVEEETAPTIGGDSLYGLATSEGVTCRAER